MLLQAQQLRASAQEPYAYRFDRSHYTSDVQQQYAHLEAGQEDESAQVAVAGRVVARRTMGKLAFLAVRDDKGQIQVGVGLHYRGAGEVADVASARGVGSLETVNIGKARTSLRQAVAVWLQAQHRLPHLWLFATCAAAAHSLGFCTTKGPHPL